MKYLIKIPNRFIRKTVFDFGNKLVSWGRAYKAAAQFVLYSIGWSIFGGFLIVLGYITVLPSGFSFNSYKIAFGILEIIIGSILILLGNLSSFFKVNSEIIGDEISERFEAEKPTITA